jgi:molybdopterin synthase sulfur carrier subunit
MIIRLRAFAQFKELIGNDLLVELKEGMSVMMLLRQLADNKPDVHEAFFDQSGELKEYVILMVNKKRIPRDHTVEYALHNGDEVAVFPPVAGG